MIFTLAQKGQMPKIFTRVMKNGVPFYPVLAIALGILVGALLNVILPYSLKVQIVFSYMFIVHLFYRV